MQATKFLYVVKYEYMEDYGPSDGGEAERIFSSKNVVAESVDHAMLKVTNNFANETHRYGLKITSVERGAVIDL